MRAITRTVGPLATADADGICLSQTPTAGALLLNGTTGGTLDVPRRVLFTFAADETGHSFVITGTSTNYKGVISETVAGTTAGTVQSVLDYLVVTSIVISANATGAMTVGTNGVASSPPLPLDLHGRPQVSLQVNVTGTVNFTVQQSLDSPYTTALTDVLWVNHPDSNLVAAAADAQGNYAYIPAQTRITINSGSGSLVYTVIQAGLMT